MRVVALGLALAQPGDIQIVFGGPIGGGGGGGGGQMPLDDFAPVLPMLDLLKSPLMRAPMGPPVLHGPPRDPMMNLMSQVLGGGGPPRGPGGDPLDAFTHEVLQRMGLAPMGDAAGSTSTSSCGEDLKKFCTQTTQLTHCLSQHSDDLAPQCKQRIQRSLPHVCKQELDQLCDPFKEGILACLERNVAQLKGKCLDALIATRQHIELAKGGDANLVHPSSGSQRPLVLADKGANGAPPGAPPGASPGAPPGPGQGDETHVGAFQVGALPPGSTDYKQLAAYEDQASLGTAGYGFVIGVFLFMVWLSGDGNTVRFKRFTHTLTGYQFEAPTKKPSGNHPYGALSSV